MYIASRERIHSTLQRAVLKMSFSFLKVGYVSSLEGSIYHHLLVASLKHARNNMAYGKWYGIEFSFKPKRK